MSREIHYTVFCSNSYILCFIYDFTGLFATHKYISAIKYINYIYTVNNKLILFNLFLFIYCNHEVLNNNFFLEDRLQWSLMSKLSLERIWGKFLNQNL